MACVDSKRDACWFFVLRDLEYIRWHKCIEINFANDLSAFLENKLTFKTKEFAAMQSSLSF